MLPTETENFSLAVLEAMAAGCPILSTVCPGNDEVLRDGDNSVLTAVGDAEAQTDALRKLLADAALRQKLGASAQHEAEKYRLERMVENYAALYHAAP
jgi:glycosyltransferase involved in cell wall biosynthesis